MAMIVGVAGVAVAVFVGMVVRMPGHSPILPARKLGRLSNALIRHFDTVLAGMD
jgi:hypothetical protein